jgi:hypothetical protein
MNRFKGLAKYLFTGAWFIAGCSNPQPNVQLYTGRYEKAIKEQTNYVDVIDRKGELIVIASWDKYEKPLRYLNGDNFMVKGFGWAMKFTRGANKGVTGFVMTGDAPWRKVDRDSSIYQLKKWQVFTDSAKLHIYPILTTRLRSVAGRYGDKDIIIRDDHAFLITSRGDKTQLYPISDSLFVTGEYTLKIMRPEKVDINKIEIRYKNGYTETLTQVKNKAPFSKKH